MLPPLLRGADCTRGDEQIVDSIRDAFSKTNRTMLERGRHNHRLRGMGTTAVSAFFVGRRMFVAHVGDSRAYLIRNGTIRRLTTDHTWVQALCEAGMLSREEAELHGARHMLLKSLGDENWRSGPDVKIVDWQEHDRVVLVTDGITNVIDDDQLRDVVMCHKNSQVAAVSLVASALEQGTGDDATCIVMSLMGSDCEQVEAGETLVA
jgi:protein phosphatase